MCCVTTPAYCIRSCLLFPFSSVTCYCAYVTFILSRHNALLGNSDVRSRFDDSLRRRWPACGPPWPAANTAVRHNALLGNSDVKSRFDDSLRRRWPACGPPWPAANTAVRPVSDVGTGLWVTAQAVWCRGPVWPCGLTAGLPVSRPVRKLASFP